MKRLVLVILFAALIPTQVAAEKETRVSVVGGFIKDNDYRALSVQSKSTYAMGFLDGILASPLFSGAQSEMSQIENCTSGMTTNQIVAILDKWLENNPAKWQQPMNILATLALQDGCGI